MMQQVAVKDDLVKMETSLLQKVAARNKVSISEAVDPLKSELHELLSKVQVLENSCKDLEHGTGGGIQDLGLKHKVDEIEMTIATMKADGKRHVNTVIATVVVVGGLKGAGSLEEAETWFKDYLRKYGLKMPRQVYHKGDQFKGLIFASFAEEAAKQEVVAAFQNQNLKFKGDIF